MPKNGVASVVERCALARIRIQVPVSPTYPPRQTVGANPARPTANENGWIRSGQHRFVDDHPSILHRIDVVKQ